MTRTLQFVMRVATRNPAAVCMLLTFITLSVDFVTGREIRFPLLYVLPIAVTAWLGRKALAYALSISLPLVRVVFENLWQAPESFRMESLNSTIEAFALSLYVYLVSRQAGRTTQMKSTITTQHEEMTHLRTFARMAGTTLQGRGISPGLADGVAVHYVPELRATLSEERISSIEVELEAARLDRALAASVSDLNKLRERLEAQQALDEISFVEMRVIMLSDPGFARGCRRRLTEDLVRAEGAVMAEVRHMEQMMLGCKQEFMRARAADIRDIGLLVLRKLETSSEESHHRLASLPPGTVVVAEELLLSDALQMDTVNVVAIVTERTGPASHVAMLARARGIPAVCDIADATSVLVPGDHLLVDAEAGSVTVAPTQVQAARFTLRKAQSVPYASSTDQEPVQPCVTKDGVAIGLHANIGRPDEAVIVLEHGLDGVGLFRSEYLFLQTERPPDLGAQTAAYSEVAAMLHPRPVVIRTMDLGGDKIPRFSGAPGDSAIRAGLRGLAYSLAEDTLFRTQIMAIVRAAQRGNVSMMFPMVMGVADLREARCLVDDLLQREAPGKRISIGAMIETPAAAFDIHGILDFADFVSIGTNDLAHSILTMDRGSQGQAGVISFLHPSVLRATHQVIQAAAEKGVTLSVCGEAASDPTVACLLIGMGVRNLSINPFLASRLRRAIQQVTLGHIEALAKDILDAKTGKEVQDLLSSVFCEKAT